MDFIFDPGLVLFLPLYGLDGASFMSKDAYGHGCSVTGALWQHNGRCFDGTDDRVHCGTSAVLDLTANFTLEMWLNVSQQNSAFIAKRTNDHNWPYVVYLDNATQKAGLYADDGAQGYVNPVATMPFGAWTHYVVTRNGTTINFYLNGQADAGNPQTLKQGNSDPDAYFTIGRQNAGGAGWVSPLLGTVGEVRVYSRALSPLEIQHSYLATKWRYR